MKLSILDQSPVPTGGTPENAVKNSLKLAQLADYLGYHRYWLSEHHHTQGLACVSPELLVSHLGAHTSRIRVGSGGVLLSHYSPYKVAENFRLLETLYPGRIDCGIGRSPGGDPRTTLALSDGLPAQPKEAFPRQVQDVLNYLNNEDPTDPRLAGLQAMPLPETRGPEVWLLGSSTRSASYAADFGTAFSFAHFINPIDGPSVAHDYRSRFNASSRSASPQLSVCVYVVCAETDEEAAYEAQSLEYWLIKTQVGDTSGIPTVQEAEAFKPTNWQNEQMQVNRRKMIVGSQETVRAGLEYMANEYGADELMILTNVHDQNVRLRSYELIAEVFELNSIVV